MYLIGIVDDVVFFVYVVTAHLFAYDVGFQRLLWACAVVVVS